MASSAIPTTMAAAVLVEPERLELQTVPVPDLAGNDVLIRVRAAGICGTDLHVFRDRRPHRVHPMIMGHEFAGEVVAFGPGVSNVQAGARVVAEGRAGTGFRRPGAYAEYVSVPGEMVHLLPPTVELLDAALVDPLACAIRAVDRARLSPGARVAVIGQGSSGLCMVQAARALMGCEVAAIDHHDERLALSQRFGATLTVNPRSADAAAALAEWTGGKGVDCVLEATGRESGIALALRIVRREGTVVAYGVFGQPVPVDLDRIMGAEITVVGSCASVGCWPRAIELLASGAADLRSIISRVMPLRSLPEAFALLEQHREVVKVVITP